MRWGLAVVLIISLVVISGCIVIESPKDEADPVIPEPIADPVVEPPEKVETVEVVEPTEETVEEQPEEEMEPAEEVEPVEAEPTSLGTLKEYMASGERKYNGYGYVVSNTQTGPYGIIERGDFILLKYDHLQLVEDYSTDTVLINRKDKTARGTCLDRGCASSLNEEFDVDYERFNPETILDFIKKYENMRVTDEKDSMMVSDHETNLITLQNGMQIHVEKRTHFPLVILKDGKKIKETEDSTFYTVGSQNLTLATKVKFLFD